MTFEEWWKQNKWKGYETFEEEALAQEAWNYQQARIDELEHKYPMIIIKDDKGDIRLQTDVFGNVSIGKPMS